MLVLNPDYYSAWAKIRDPAARYWIRLWQDGLHGGAAHPEWAFSPLDIPCLGELRNLFVRAPNQPDWGRPQRRAIRTLASRRDGLPDAARFSPPTVDTANEWDAYWEKVAYSKEDYRTERFDNLKTLLGAPESDLDFPSITTETEALVAQLQLNGLSDYELFVRGGTGIIDPAARRSMPHLERVIGFLDWLARAPTKEFVVWTGILHNRETPSRRMARRLAGREIASPLEWMGSTGFGLINDAPFAITRCTTTHSLTAFLDHRVEAFEALRNRAAKLTTTGLRLSEESHISLTSSPDRQPWRHTLPKVSPYDYLPSPNPTTEPVAFAAALEAVEEDPEESIRSLCDAFERQFNKSWPITVGQRYTRTLRGGLARRCLIAIQETEDRWDNRSDAPSWLSWLEENREGRSVEFHKLAKVIGSSGVHADELLCRRLETVACDKTRYRSPAWITGWLYLAKGVRNREVHAGRWPTKFRSVATFLARVLLHSFASAFPAPVESDECRNDAV